MTTTRVNRDTPWWANMQMYWLEDQATITFHSQVSLSQGKDAVITSLKLDALNQFINQRGFALIFSDSNAASRTHDKETGETHGGEQDHSDPPAMMFLPIATVKGEDQGTLVVGFFNVETQPKAHA